MSVASDTQAKSRLSLYEQYALKRKAERESPNRRFSLDVGLEMDRSTVERWLARLLKKPDVDSLTEIERGFVIEHVWEFISTQRWSIVGSGEAPRFNGVEALNLFPKATLLTRQIFITGPKEMTIKDAPEVLPGPDEEYAGHYLASQGIPESEYQFVVTLECVDPF